LLGLKENKVKQVDLGIKFQFLPPSFLYNSNFNSFRV